MSDQLKKRHVNVPLVTYALTLTTINKRTNIVKFLNLRDQSCSLET